MKHYSETITLETTDPLEFIDITDRVKRAFDKSGVKRGVMNVYTMHTTTSIKINERCEHLQRDMCKYLAELAPGDKGYRHDEVAVDGRANAHSHLLSLSLSASESIPVIEGGLQLGDWQSVFFVELDGPRKARTVIVTVMGE